MGRGEIRGKTRLHGLIIEVSFPNRMEEIAITTGHLTPPYFRGTSKDKDPA